MTMTAEDESGLLEACRTPRFLAELLPLTGLSERTCREMLQGLKKRKLVRLAQRRWALTRAGERYAKELLTQIKTNQQEAEERRRRIETLRAGFQTRLLNVRKEVEGALSECQRIPRATQHARVLEPELEALISLQQGLDASPDEEGLRESERTLDDRLPRVSALARQARTALDGLGLFELVREPMFIADPLWLLCTACKQLQGQHRSYLDRYECVNCKQEGRPFAPSQTSVKPYSLPPEDRQTKFEPQQFLRRNLRRVLELYHTPAPVAEKILDFFDGLPLTVNDLHFACAHWMGEAGTRYLVAAVFQIHPDYPFPWPTTGWRYTGPQLSRNSTTSGRHGLTVRN